jgi:hypothetical protein
MRTLSIERIYLTDGRRADEINHTSQIYSEVSLRLLFQLKEEPGSTMVETKSRDSLT